MRTSNIFAAAAAIVALTSTARAEQIGSSDRSDSARTIIKVSCYRGPWKGVIWDRPNPEFIQSLEDNGLTSQQAFQVADSICRNPRLVDNQEGLAREVRKQVATARNG